MKSFFLLSLIPPFALAIWPAPSSSSLGNSTLWIVDDVPITYNGPHQVGYMHIQASPNQYAPLRNYWLFFLLRRQAIRHTEIQQMVPAHRTLQPLSKPQSLGPLELCFNKTSSHGSSIREIQTSNRQPAPRPLSSLLRYNNSSRTLPISWGQSPAKLTNRIQSKLRYLGKSLSQQIRHTVSHMDLPHLRNFFTSTRLDAYTRRMRLFPFRMLQHFPIVA